MNGPLSNTDLTSPQLQLSSQHSESSDFRSSSPIPNLKPEKFNSALNLHRYKRSTKIVTIKETANEEEDQTTRRGRQERKRLPEGRKKIILEETRINYEIAYKNIIADN